MATNFVFKETTTKSMKIAGILNTTDMTVDIDGDEKKLSTLLSPFQNEYLEISIKIKTEEELDEPEDMGEDTDSFSDDEDDEDYSDDNY